VWAGWSSGKAAAKDIADIVQKHHPRIVAGEGLAHRDLVAAAAVSRSVG
jgi:hypothetical protein